MSDTIYRQDAIDTISAKADEWEINGVIPQCQGLRTAVPILESLPPAQAQRCMNTIRRSDAIDALMKTFWFLNPDSITDVIMGVEDAQPQRIKGHWTEDKSCPFCGGQPWYEFDIHTLKFCPYCGADMREEENERHDLQTGGD